MIAHRTQRAARGAGSGRLRRQTLGLLLAVLVPAAAVAERPFLLRPPLRVDQDMRSIPRPQERVVSELFGIVYNSWVRHVSLDHKVGVARKQPALNVNAWDEVPDSSWFTNRMGRRSLSSAEIVKGLEGQPPEPGRWRIVRQRGGSYTPGFDVEDSAGRRYALKFDFPETPERNSAAERIGTLVMHAAGYHVPHNSIVTFRREDLYLDDKSYYRDALDRRRPLTPRDLDAAFTRIRPGPDGRYRGLASLYLPGPPLGPFVYTGTREDDPNDIIPHEFRRELRGLRVIACWINHADVKDVNALDVYIADASGKGYVKHYFLDFGSAMGSGDFVNGPYRVGHEYIFDGPAMTRSFWTLGAWQRPWERDGRIRHPEVGYYQVELFEPQAWKPNYPNLAFERMDDGDAYWGAKIVTAFSNETIRELAAAGQYSRPEVTRYMEEVLRGRRDAIGRYWLDRITPLEDPVLDLDGPQPRLRFGDLAVERGYVEPGARVYRFWAEDARGRRLPLEGTARSSTGELELPGLSLLASTLPRGETDRYGRTPLLRLLVQANRRDGTWALPMELVAGQRRAGASLEILGWTHAVR